MTTSQAVTSESATRARRSEYEVVAFAVAAISVSWLLWAPLVAAKWGWIGGANPYWHLVGGLGPAIAAIAITAAFDGRSGLRMLNPTSIHWSNSLVIVGWGASIVTGSVICTCLFNSTSGSIAVVAAFHAALDIFIGSPTGGEVLPNVMGASIVITALIIPRRFGRTNLSRSPKVTRTTTEPGRGRCNASTSMTSP